MHRLLFWRAYFGPNSLDYPRPIARDGLVAVWISVLLLSDSSSVFCGGLRISQCNRFVPAFSCLPTIVDSQRQVPLVFPVIEACKGRCS